MYVLNEYMEFGVDTPHIATYNFKLVFYLLFSTIYSTPGYTKIARKFAMSLTARHSLWRRGAIRLTTMTAKIFRSSRSRSSHPLWWPTDRSDPDEESQDLALATRLVPAVEWGRERTSILLALLSPPPFQSSVKRQYSQTLLDKDTNTDSKLDVIEHDT